MMLYHKATYNSNNWTNLDVENHYSNKFSQDLIQEYQKHQNCIQIKENLPTPQ